MAFRMDKLTIKAQEAVQQAQAMAAERGHAQVTGLHLLAALMSDREGIVSSVLQKLGANRRQIDAIIESELGRIPRVSGGSPPGGSSELMELFDAAQREADAMKDDFVSTEHLLLALAKSSGTAAEVLKVNAVRAEDLLKALQADRKSVV